VIDAQKQRQWSQTLHDLSQELEILSGTTEAEFLSTGERLQDFYRQAGEITRISSEISDLISGAEIGDAIAGLKEIMQNLSDWLCQADGEPGRDSAALENILGLLGEIEQLLGGFTRIHKTLRMLGIATRIESARLGEGGAGFDSLADDVGVLSEQVREKVLHILDHKSELIAVISRTLGLVQSVSAGQQEDQRQIMTKARDSLEELVRINDRCCETASFVSGSVGEVSQHVGEVVASMQFHDIVRQQIEHVRDALVELSRLVATALEKETGKEGEPNEDVRLAIVRESCAVQAAQLRHARDEFSGAIDSMIGNLRDIGSRQEMIAETTRAAAGGGEAVGGSSFSQLEKSLSVVTGLLAKSADDNRKLAAAVSELTGTVSAISGFIGDIEHVGEEIELIALNASVKAARTGIDGAALGVLAEEVQRLSLDARKQSTAVSEPLRTVAGAAGSLCTEVDAKVSRFDAEGEGMASAVEGMMQTIGKVNAEVAGMLVRMDDTVASLSHDIGQTTSGISAHLQMVPVLGDVAAALDRIVSESQEMMSCGGAPLTGSELLAMSKRYTMQSERDIHAMINGLGTAALPGSTGPGGFPAGVTSVAGSSELGDNVEFF
jgi:methyl-accepting chemotaxis protein